MYSFFIILLIPPASLPAGGFEGRGRIETAARLPALRYTDWLCAPATYGLICNQIISRVKGVLIQAAFLPVPGVAPLKNIATQGCKAVYHGSCND
jgi:hypothetical protein